MSELTANGLAQLEEWKAEKAARTEHCETNHRACVGDADNGSQDCRHMTSALSWWCTNRDARTWRSTSIPDAYDCPFFQPIRTTRERKRHQRARILWRKLASFIIK